LFEYAAEIVKERVEAVTWEAFWRTAVEAQPATVAAKDLGLTKGEVYVARSRVMKHTREIVERHLAQDLMERQ
jgi:RNA polymerase sigma-70 factor, ECF subfamily